MSTIKIDIPGEDAWVLIRLSQILAQRLAHGSDEPKVRQSLLRLLFGLQRLPILIPDLCISLGVGRIFIEMNCELFGLVGITEEGHTEFRLQYLDGGNHCLYWNEFLTGGAKRDAINERLIKIEEALVKDFPLTMADYSEAGYVDEPPLEAYMEYAASFDQP